MNLTSRIYDWLSDLVASFGREHRDGARPWRETVIETARTLSGLRPETRIMMQAAEFLEHCFQLEYAGKMQCEARRDEFTRKWVISTPRKLQDMARKAEPKQTDDEK